MTNEARYDSTRTMEAKSESIHRREVRRFNAEFGFRTAN